MTNDKPVRRSRRAWEVQALIASKRMKASGAKTLLEFSEKDYGHFCKLVEAYSALGTVFSKEVLDKWPKERIRQVLKAAKQGKFFISDGV